MNSFSLISFLNSNLNVGENELASIIENCETKVFKKDQFLLREGEKCRHTFYVERGLLRQYSIDEKGKEHILNFGPENWFITDRASVFFDESSDYFIQAVEDTKVVLINEETIGLLTQKISSFADFNTRLLHNHIRQLQKRVNQLLSVEAEERYLDFVKMYPDILLRVPQTMVASYLGITPESLSRVRKGLADSNFKK
ncbi:MAG TPA: Crp/Fnr family transcriptional regulator [Edaphocola sp.]|nr:Crp/Fnr family transcriptional regulator [Edaphocola sp.]